MGVPNVFRLISAGPQIRRPTAFAGPGEQPRHAGKQR